jgi:Ca2+-binding RTX toxin-like protein
MFLFSRKALAGIGCTAAAVASTALFAMPAQAASAGLAKVVGSSAVQFNALLGKSNGLVVTISGRTVTLNDKVAIKAGKGCKAVKGDKTKVKCTTKKKTTKISVALGDKNDSVTNKTSVYMLADGGSGNDTLTGGSGKDQLQGGTGNDKLYGKAGNDTIFGGSGNDYIGGSVGNDHVEAGTGVDKVFGDAGNDTIFGGSGKDRLVGGVGNDQVSGDADADSISGDAGDDVVLGGAGNDQVSGAAGRDIIVGEAGNDVLAGDAGDDTLFGLAGNDKITGGVGNDCAHRRGRLGRQRRAGRQQRGPRPARRRRQHRGGRLLPGDERRREGELRASRGRDPGCRRLGCDRAGGLGQGRAAGSGPHGHRPRGAVTAR